MLFITIDINENSFVQQANEALSLGGSNLHQILSKCLTSEIQRSIASSVPQHLLLTTKVTGNSNISAHSIKEAISSDGYNFFRIQIQIDLILGEKISESAIQIPNVMKLQPANYGHGVKLFDLKHKSMKTRERFTIELYHTVIPSNILRKTSKNFEQCCDCPKHLLSPIKHSVWEWLQQFVCIQCGKRYICGCFKDAVAKYTDIAIEQQPQYTVSGWPHRYLKAVEESEFRNSICHLCTGKPSNLFYCHPMYGSPIRVKYGVYMRMLEIKDDLSERDAENKVRETLGIPKVGEGWVNETQLFKLVQSLFTEYDVFREASPEWLGRQRLDIYIPKLALAIEYQGEQHYKPVSLFGGEEGLKKTQERDKLKRKLCNENNTKLVYFSYKDDISQATVEKKLMQILNSMVIPPFLTEVEVE